MNKATRKRLSRFVPAAARTHFDVRDDVAVPNSVSRVDNHQSSMGLLIDPPESANVRTHSSDDIRYRGSKRVPTTAAIRDRQQTGPLNVHGLEHDVDPATGYLQEESGLPVVDVPLMASEEDLDEDEFTEAELKADFDEDDESSDEDLEAGSDEFDFGSQVESSSEEDGDDEEFDDLEAGAEEFDDEFETEASSDEEFDDLPDINAGADDFDDLPEEDSIAVADVDEIPDQVDSEELNFATIANTIHVIRANRIIASIGSGSASKAGVADVYLKPQFQDVVVANVDAKGLRKGLVQSGFVLAKVAIKAKATSRVVKAKVEAAVSTKLQALAKRDKALDQSMAIAAVGINRRFFKDANNELRDNLSTELVQAGVRGGQRIVHAMFAKYGVSYAKSIITLAKKISAMPEEMRDQYVEAFDMAEDEDMSEDDIEAELDDEEEGMEDEDEDSFEPIAASVTAALRSPVRRSAALLKASGGQSSAVLRILNGNQSLV